MLEPLYGELKKRVLGCNYIQIDETTIPVLDKDKPGATRKGYHWVVRSPALKSLFFHYDKGSRAQYVAVELLKDFRGAVQSDGYGAYDIYENKRGVLLLGCRAHIRRKFEHALANDPERAEYALRLIGQLYAIERRVKEQGIPLDEIKAIRKKKALRYAYALYPRMARYVTDGRYRIDNNLAEQAVRPLALGRKNYLFCRNHEAAYNTAVVYSLLGTCRLWGIDPVKWLADVFSRIQDCSLRRLKNCCRINGSRKIETAFRVDPERRNIKSGGGGSAPPPAMSRVTLPRRGIFINGCRILSYEQYGKSGLYRSVWRRIHNKQD